MKKDGRWYNDDEDEESGVVCRATQWMRKEGYLGIAR